MIVKIVNLYNEPSTSSTVIYTSSTSNDKVIPDYPLTVLDKVTVDYAWKITEKMIDEEVTVKKNEVK